MWKSLDVTMVLVLCLFVACGQDAAPEAEQEPPANATEPVTGEESEEPAARDLSLDSVEFATMSNDAQDLMLTYSTAELFWPQVGFSEPAEVIVTFDALPAIVSGETWIAQGDTSTFWAAMDEGSVDLVMVGVDKDNEIRILGARPGIASVEDIETGMTASGGDVGDYDELVLREVLTELGVNPDDLQIISMGGGADARMGALIAEQLDLGIQQPRNIGPLTDAGGAILYEEAAEVPQEIWIVTREVWNENRDAVCAFIEGRIMGKLWAAEGEDMRANIDEALEIVRRYDIDPSEDELADWARELQGNQSLDGGTTIEGLDQFQANLQQLGIVSEDFEWRDHADFSCLHEAQENLGLEPRPVQ